MLIKSVKYSTNRNKQFQIKTVVYEEGGISFVKKEAVTPHSVNHIKQIAKNFELLQHSNFSHVPPKLEENIVIFPFVSGTSFDSKLIELIQNHSVEEFIKEIHNYRFLLLNEETVNFYETEDFREIFGDGKSFEGMPAFKVSNVDMNFDNMIYCGTSINIIDYEWVFDFPIPVDYVFYRNLGVFLSKYSCVLDESLTIEDIIDGFGIEKEFLFKFDELEKKLVNYIGFESSHYNGYKQEVVSFKSNNKIHELTQKPDLPYFQVFMDKGNGFNEEDSMMVDLRKENELQIFEIDLPSHYLHSIRIDPISLISVVNLKLKVVSNETVFDITDSVVSLHDTKIINKHNNTFELLNLSHDPQMMFIGKMFQDSGNKKLLVEIRYSRDISSNLLELHNRMEENEIKITNLLNENVQFNELLVEKEKEKEILNNRLVDKENETEVMKNNFNILEKKYIDVSEMNHKITSTFIWKLLKKARLIRI
jgi:hypothetical protein